MRRREAIKRSTVLKLLGVALYSTTVIASVLADPLPSTTVPGNLGIVANYFTPEQSATYGNASAFDALKNAGFSLARILPDWQLIEKQKNVYDFSYCDWLLDQFQSRNMRPIIGLGLNNPLYGVYTRINTDDERLAFGNFVRAMARRYKGRQVIWEIWNEPNISHFWRREAGETLSTADAVKEYLALVDTVVPIIRQEDPSALIIGPAAANYNTPWLKEALTQGLLSRLDGLSVHPYQLAGRPELVIAQHNQVQGWIPAPDKGKPVFFTEVGYSTGTGANEVPVEIQTKYLKRTYLMGLMLGTNATAIYSFVDADKNEPCAEADKCYGLFTHSSAQAKPGYSALTHLAESLSGFHYTQRISNAVPTVYILKFQNQAGSVRYAVWDSQTTTALAIKLPDGQTVQATQDPLIVTGQ
jgi:hypothetical protein